MTTTARPDYRFVNKKQPRLEGVAKVTGRTQYTADVKLPRLAHMKLLTAPHAHAIIKKLDTSRAKAYPGVAGVFTADDLPAHLQRDGAARLTTPFAWKEVVFFGQPVAGVVAEDPSIAEEALDLIEVEYEPLPVMDILDALKMNCPPVRGSLSGSDNSELAAHSVVAASEDVHSDKNPPNVTHRLVWARGDVEAGFKEADYIIEKSFHASWVHQGYIETMSATVDCDLDNNFHIWLSTQGSFTSRENMAKMLGVPESKIVVEFLEMGGGFGAVRCYLPRHGRPHPEAPRQVRDEPQPGHSGRQPGAPGLLRNQAGRQEGHDHHRPQGEGRVRLRRLPRLAADGRRQPARQLLQDAEPGDRGH